MTSEWHLVRLTAPGRPSSRHSHGMVLDEADRKLIMLGGVTEGGVAREAHYYIAVGMSGFSTSISTCASLMMRL